ncbi:MAG: cytochrome c [Thermodesulfobacteriota bacterium]
MEDVKGTKRHTILLFTLFIIVAFLAGCKTETEKPAFSKATGVPQEFTGGEGLFDTNCARCHGETGIGTDIGPPLVHKIYEPNHHSDTSFYLAVQRGVRAHHWGFGDMSRIDGVTEGDVTEIIAYVRWLQRQAGIY